jgi:eukaryotic-like serine/threonine-protein kinase
MADHSERVRASLAGRYTIERELGRGGMATVYLARDLKHDRLVALKVLRPELAASLGAERFLREIQVTAQLTHPNILPLLDSGRADDFLYYVTPYVEGESLRSRLNREKQLPVDEALRLAMDVAGALDYAHRREIVHRDIKPENILLEEGQAVVADFGIARALYAAERGKLTETGLAVGTAAYMSPEQAAAEQADGRSDIYSLGCVLYEMLAGDPPFTGPTAQVVLARRLTGSVPSLHTVRDSVPRDIEQVIGRALAKLPADRFATAAEFADALTPGGPASRRIAFLPSWVRAGGVAAASLAILGAALVARMKTHGAREPAPNGVAVLYFDNLSSDTADAYLADGLTEELISRLGQVARLTVKSRNAVRRFRGRLADDPAAVGRALDVAHLVSGSVRHAGARLRVTVELVNTATGDRMWGQQYDRAEVDLLGIQEDIAVTIATAIGGRLLPAERSSLTERPTREPSAYDHFVKGNYFLGQRTAPAVGRAIEEYRAALQLDPRFTEALARVAYSHALFLDWGWHYPDAPPESVLARGVAAADSALRRDSTSSDAWMARAYVLAMGGTRTAAPAIGAFQRAIALDPRNAEAYHQYGWLLMGLERDSASAEASRRALELDPARLATILSLGALRTVQRRYDEGLRWQDSALNLEPGIAYVYAWRALSRLTVGRAVEARRDAELAIRLGSPSHGEAALAAVEAHEGHVLSARRRVERVLREAVDSLHPHSREALFIGWALVALNERERAIHLLERVRPRDWQLAYRLRYAGFDPIRADPRFQRLVEEARPSDIRGLHSP